MGHAQSMKHLGNLQAPQCYYSHPPGKFTIESRRSRPWCSICNLLLSIGAGSGGSQFFKFGAASTAPSADQESYRFVAHFLFARFRGCAFFLLRRASTGDAARPRPHRGSDVGVATNLWRMLFFRTPIWGLRVAPSKKDMALRIPEVAELNAKSGRLHT